MTLTWTLRYMSQPMLVTFYESARRHPDSFIPSLHIVRKDGSITDFLLTEARWFGNIDEVVAEFPPGCVEAGDQKFVVKIPVPRGSLPNA